MPREPGLVEWRGGPAAQLEFVSAPGLGGRGCLLRYTPPYRTTIRPPADVIHGDHETDFGPAVIEFDKLIQSLYQADPRKPSRQHSAQPTAEPGDWEADLKTIGTMLWEMFVPQYVQFDLRTKGYFLEIGTDRTLQRYPMEIMNDGEEFLCLKHALGRYVNGESASMLMTRQHPSYASFATGNKPSILVVCVPEPNPRGDVVFSPLRYAIAEAESIRNAVPQDVEVTALIGPEATFFKFFETLTQKRKKYHIIHFIGHAYYDDQDPRQSALALYDKNMTTAAIKACFGNSPPILCFMNACETAKTESVQLNQQNVYSLAYAFLEAGSYLIGSRWQLGDETAASFAKDFYEAVFQKEKTLGEGVVVARQEARVRACNGPIGLDRVGWLAHVFFGDPRLRIRCTRPRRASQSRLAAG